MLVLYILYINVLFYRSQDLKWMEPLYSTGQRLGKIADPIAGDLNIIQFLPKSSDSTFPMNVNNFIFYTNIFLFFTRLMIL